MTILLKFLVNSMWFYGRFPKFEVIFEPVSTDSGLLSNFFNVRYLGVRYLDLPLYQYLDIMTRAV